MAFYLKREGLKALHEMKGTHSQGSIMHVISYLGREKWTGNYLKELLYPAAT